MHMFSCAQQRNAFMLSSTSCHSTPLSKMAEHIRASLQCNLPLQYPHCFKKCLLSKDHATLLGYCTQRLALQFFYHQQKRSDRLFTRQRYNMFHLPMFRVLLQNSYFKTFGNIASLLKSTSSLAFCDFMVGLNKLICAGPLQW